MFVAHALLIQFRSILHLSSGLSQEVYYSAALRLDSWSLSPAEATIAEPQWRSHLLIQFTASAIKNSEFKTRLVHTKIKSLLWPERQRFWLGWTNPHRWLQEGQEAIGLNNLGFIEFIWSEKADEQVAIQDIYWYSSWGKPRIAVSRFVAQLQLRPPHKL